MSTAVSKRERLLQAASALIHAQGFGRTTLADIARASEVPLGNVYYYFKTKDDLCRAVIAQRRADLAARFAQWEAEPDPRRRLIRFLELPVAMRDTLVRHGCPVGGLVQELNKAPGELAQEAHELLAMQLDWLHTQFAALGRADAESLAVEMIGRLQGVSLLANSMDKPQWVDEQVERVRAWLHAV